MADRHNFSHHDLSRQVFLRVKEVRQDKEHVRHQIIAWHHKHWRVNTGVPAAILPAVRAAVDEANKDHGEVKASTVRNLIVAKL